MSPQGTRRRSFDNVISFPPIAVRQLNGVWNNNYRPASKSTFKGIQETVSVGHPRNRHTGRYESGGPFFTVKIDPGFSPRIVRLEGLKSGELFKYSGPIVIPFPASGYSGFSIPSQDSSYLDKYGTEAISIVDPTNPNADTGVALGEILHDRRLSLPGIQSWQRRTEVAKAAGGEYLSAVFGWLPLVRDIKNTHQSIKDGNRIIENYSAASGTLVHREFAFDDIVSEQETLVTTSARCVYSASANVTAFNDPPVPMLKKRKSTTSRWFSGSFTYSASDASSVGRCLGLESEFDKLYGLTLTPDVLWELAPWSWAIDWFSNAGDVIKNVTNLGLAGLVMKYGYIMEETSIVDTYSMPATGLTGISGAPPVATVKYTVKRRREANPFGFGVTWEGLSPTQLAITAALGITRL